uniref:Pyridoxine 5'-phosphate synthase n=1 Tax=Zeugodacus cucurbitae TaxID=28588 RepID=A0A0A1X0X1_ZEUCU
MKCSVVLVVSALLLVQLAGALPHVKRESEDSSSEIRSAQERLMIYTFTEIAKLYNWVLENGSVVINNAVKELDEIPDKDDLLQANITRLSKIGSEVSQFKLEKDERSITKLLEYMFSFDALMDDYENMPSDSKLKLTLKTAFDNNGYKKFEDEFLLKVDEFFKNFDHAFVEYVKTLTAEEKVKQSRFFQWHEDFTAETNVATKLEKFDELFV